LTATAGPPISDNQSAIGAGWHRPFARDYQLLGSLFVWQSPGVIDLRAGDQPRAALEGSTANPWRSLRPAAFQPASSVGLTSARNPICAGIAAIRRTHYAVIDYAFLVGDGVASRITVTALSPECLRNPIAHGKFSG
jgi:hypothetical protein